MPHISKPSAPSTQAAPSELTAPRKPVAFLSAGHVFVTESVAKAHGDAIPLGPMPDLQPLWALVKGWGDEACRYGGAPCTNEDRGYSNAMFTAADELRKTLEAMQ